MRSASSKIRCAVYTRKSTEDGLEQEFNSLDAQRDACSAYVLSQMHEGWTLVPEHYDDGGFSGGNMERPGLKRLLDDVAAGKVDVILIYKIDRLTRSLMDFAKIVEVLDKAGASFVSITQAFNTTTSMGRLTLNMLLSFAQFEREVTGERIRDKIAASKRKGLWMGGPVPLGYDVNERKLIVNEREADLVHHIMRRYLALGSVRELIAELDREGYRTKVQQRSSGPHKGGCAFQRGTLFHLLRNRIYRGEIIHKGKSYAGEHAAIVDQPLWDAVQAAMRERASGTAKRQSTHVSLLAGRLLDGDGRAMTPTHANRSGRRYRYYCTRPDKAGDTPPWRVPASDLERIVIDEIADMMEDQGRVYGLIQHQAVDARTVQATLRESAATANTLRKGTGQQRLAYIAKLNPAVQLFEDRMVVRLDTSTLIEALGLVTSTGDDAAIDLVCDAVRVRKGHDIRLIIPGEDRTKLAEQKADEKMVGLLSEAQAVRDLILGSPQHSLHRIAKDAGRCRTRLAKLFMLAHLAPSIVTAIIEGRHPPELDRKRLLDADLPADWTEQRKMLGLA